jgi:hypothetical protein
VEKEVSGEGSKAIAEKKLVFGLTVQSMSYGKISGMTKLLSLKVFFGTYTRKILERKDHPHKFPASRTYECSPPAMPRRPRSILSDLSETAGNSPIIMPSIESI